MKEELFIIKVLIIGVVASGKSTLARRLSKECNIKCYEIDSIVHDDYNKKKRNNIEQQKIIKIIDQNDDWIIEGTLRKNLDNLLSMATLIIYIDIPLYIRKRRIIWRFIKQKIGLEKCNYKPTLKILKMMFEWTNTFEEKRLEFEKKIKKYNDKLVKLDTVDKVNNYHL